MPDTTPPPDPRREAIRRVLAEADGFSYEHLESHDYQRHADAILGLLPSVLGPTGPLPIGWHRIAFRKVSFAPTTQFCVYANDIATAVLLSTSLKADSDVVDDSITIESWSDYPSDTRP